MTADEHWPEELRLTEGGKRLSVVFASRQLDFDAEYLRVESPSAEVKGHGTGQEKTVGGKRHVRITRLEPVGSYAVRIVFDDGHSTGIYTWSYLAELARNRAEIWARYLKSLEILGISRD